MKRRNFFLIIILGLTVIVLNYCGESRDKVNFKSQNQLVKFKIIDPSDTLKADVSLINLYKDGLLHAKKRDSVFINNLLAVIAKFNNRNLDTTILTIGNINGDIIDDTINTRIFYRYNTIWVSSIWIQNKDTLWSYKFSNPYLWINNDDLFEYDTRSIWVTFTIGIYYGPPDILDFLDYLGILDFPENANLKNIDFKNKYKGGLVTWGEPETRPCLYYWDNTLKVFKEYYCE